MAACNWSWTVLRLSGRLTALVISSATYSLGICGSAWFLAAHGLTALSGSWFGGATLAAIVASIAVAAAPRQARHRRSMESSAAGAPSS
jgi:hypothetical protein